MQDALFKTQKLIKRLIKHKKNRRFLKNYLTDITQNKSIKKKVDYHKTNYGSFEDSYIHTFDGSSESCNIIKRSNSVCSLLDSSIPTVQSYVESFQNSKTLCRSFSGDAEIFNYVNETMPNTSGYTVETFSPHESEVFHQKLDLSSPVIHDDVINNANAFEVNKEDCHLKTPDNCVEEVSSDRCIGVNRTVINESQKANDKDYNSRCNLVNAPESETSSNDAPIGKDFNRKVFVSSSCSVKSHNLRNPNSKAIAIANQNNKLISLSLSIMLAALLQVVRCLTVMLDDTLSCFRQDMF